MFSTAIDDSLNILWIDEASIHEMHLGKMKEEYDIWAMEMEHYLEYIDNDVWKVIQNGNSKKRISTGKDGVVRILPPVLFRNHAEAIRTRFGGNANSKKMQKAVLKQQFEAFTISSSEGLEKGYDSKRSTNKVKSGHVGAYNTCTPSTSSNNIQEREVHAGFADIDIEEMDIKLAIRNDLLSE
ncbi:hypothetical protein Tco_0566659 [Tanacetum coccineum]